MSISISDPKAPLHIIFTVSSVNFSFLYDVFSKYKSSGNIAHFTNTDFKLPYEIIPVIDKVKPIQFPSSNTASLGTDETIFTIVEQQAQYPGGKSEMARFLSANLKYPEEARKKGQDGRVMMQFVVSTDGSLRDIKVIRGISPELNAEATRLIKLMPHWIPGTQRGKNVNVRMVLPITFSLK